MKICKYCNGTGRRIAQPNNEEGSYKIHGIDFGTQYRINEPCKKCHGTGNRK